MEGGNPPKVMSSRRKSIESNRTVPEAESTLGDVDITRETGLQQNCWL